MPRFPREREGKCLTVAGHPIRFTVYAGGTKPQHTRMLASNPWRCMELALTQNGRPQADCHAYLRQAHDLHVASEAAKATARPLLMYYAFLNLAKMLIKQRRPTLDLARASHGIGEPQSNVQRARVTLTSQKVKVQRARGGYVHVLNEFCGALGWTRLPASRDYNVCDLLSQVPAVHRPYSHTRGRAERLHVIHKGEFRYDHNSRHAWVIVWVKKSEFGDRKAARELRSRSYFSKWFEQVDPDPKHKDCLAIQSKPVRYGRSPLEALGELSRGCKVAGVVSILTPNGYRYYLSNFQPAIRVGQLLASYMAMFYFGSVARYRPADYEKMLNRKFGWAIEEFLATQGHQFVYLMGNELLKREVVCPWALRSPEMKL